MGTLQEDLVNPVIIFDLDQSNDLQLGTTPFTSHEDKQAPGMGLQKTPEGLFQALSQVSPETISPEYVEDIIRGMDRVDCNFGNGYTLLHEAAKRNHLGIVWCLLTSGQHPVDAKTEEGETALSLACSYGFKDVAILLVKNGANVDSQDKQGWTPLHHCAARGRVTLAALLLLLGADSTLESAIPPRFTPDELAMINEHPRVSKLIRSIAASGLFHLFLTHGKETNKPYLFGHTKCYPGKNSALSTMCSKSNPNSPNHDPEIRKSFFALYYETYSK